MICFHCCLDSEFYESEINGDGLPYADHKLNTDNVIILNDKKSKGLETYQHICRGSDESYSAVKFPIHLKNKQYKQDKCKFNMDNHPNEFDTCRQQKYQPNIACGYILMKV